jgi:molybdate transport system substrate-binding protein
MKRAAPLLVAILAAASAAAGAAAWASAAGGEALRVLAASSLAEAFQEIGALYEAENRGEKMELTFSGSQILRTQIEHGARAGVFASADRVQMEALQRQGLVGPDSVFARNRLVVVTSRERPRVRSLADLAGRGARIVIADPNVPAGRYTQIVLEKMDEAGSPGGGLRRRILANVVSQETSVRAVLAKVSLGEADAGFVYSTDALTAAREVRVLEIPDSLNAAAEYSIAAVTGGSCPPCAERFLALVQGEAGQACLRRHGFAPPR